MQNAGAGSAEGGAGGQADRGAPGGAVPEAAAADDLPQVAQAPHAPGPGGDAEPAATGPGSRLHEFSLTVPFRSPLEAEIARGSLAPDAEPHRGVVHKELTLNGSVLAVHWTAEDPRLLRISIINFLDQLSMVVRTMQRFGPPVFR
ncbi:EKC/KEOPS complex subunit LAGE3 [Loxodonta africana]|uniref:L antigen family member 3 n=1 Tax=Loxodonta africana TaxID=9785 RepID=G3TG80_LOXAF|nr:EKC/KEOPS complex subunit LAGE3 [Loxodonta africana]XP_049728381.1 EKC/KEOPS complex subunit LAGE3 isoform X2 [Elephas maximus indicus]